jgi:hypothetical protein
VVVSQLGKRAHHQTKKEAARRAGRFLFIKLLNSFQIFNSLQAFLAPE